MAKSAAAAVITAPEIYVVPLSSLVRSESNVRKTHADVAIKELAASIATHGLIKPLAVVAQQKKGKDTGVYEVIAGGRRLAALQMLANDKRIDVDAEVACILFPSAEAVSVSLTENDSQEPMHPADQCDAFAKLIKDGLSVAQVASRFGVTSLIVERRLRLADVAPSIVSQFRAGKVSLEQMMALAVVTDHAAQESVWKAARGEWQREPSRLREALTQDRMRADHRIAQLVGDKAYQAAGGTLMRDLFATRHGTYWLDTALAEQLAQQKMTEAAHAAIGSQPCQWIDVDLEGRQYANSHDRVETIPAPLTEAQVLERDAIQSQIDAAERDMQALEVQFDDADADDEDALTEQMDALSERLDQWIEQRDAIRNGSGTLPPELVPMIGAVVRLAADGQITTAYPVTRAEDRKAVHALRAKARKVDTDSSNHQATVTHDTAPASRTHSDALTRTLTAAKTIGLRAAFAVQTETTIRMLAHALFAKHVAERAYSAGGPALALSLRRVELPSDASDAAPVAVTAIEECTTQWMDRIPGDDSQRAAWFLTEDFPVVLDVLAFCTAMQIDAVELTEAHRPGFVPDARSLNVYAEAIGYNPRDWFVPTAANYFGRVSKQVMLDGLADAGIGAEDLARIGKAKKAEAATLAEQLVAASAWTPAPVRAG